MIDSEPRLRGQHGVVVIATGWWRLLSRVADSSSDLVRHNQGKRLDRGSMQKSEVSKRHLYTVGAAVVTASLASVTLIVFNEEPAIAFALGAGVLAAAVLIPKIYRSLTTGMGLFVLAQPLTAFAIATPVATITVDNLLLVLLLVFHVLRKPVNSERGSRVVTALLIIWACTYVLRLTYVEPLALARLGVTVISFLLLYFVARRLPQTYTTLKVLSLTALGALLIFGLAAALVTVGLISRPAVGLTFGREIFGFLSPFPRTYGLNVAIDAIAFLGPLTLPMLAYWLVAPAMPLLGRVGALSAILALSGFILLFFQARGMLLSIGLSLLVAFVVTRRHGRWLLIPAAVVAGAQYAPMLYASLAGVDTVSSQLRFSNTLVLLRMISERPGDFVLGQNEGRLFYEIALELGLAQAIGGEGNDAIHNAFLSQLVGGGWLAFLSFTTVFALMLSRAIRQLRKDPHDPVWQILTISATLVIFEMLLEPARAQVIGNWIVLGLIFSVAAKRPAAIHEIDFDWKVRMRDSPHGPGHIRLDWSQNGDRVSTVARSNSTPTRGPRACGIEY